jgi:hypothetical protein
MLEINKSLTKEEYSRLRKYTSLVIASNGGIYLLTLAEQIDLGTLLKKTMLAQSLFTEAELKSF